jgi:hypothetical protein
MRRGDFCVKENNRVSEVDLTHMIYSAWIPIEVIVVAISGEFPTRKLFRK